MRASAIAFLLAGWFAVLGSSLIALFRGGPPERIAGASFLLAMVASWCVLPTDGSSFEHLEVGIAVSDLCLLIILGILAAYSRRHWPAAAIASQMISCLAHFAKLVDPATSKGAYSQMEGFAVWPMSGVLIWATWMYQRRLRIHDVIPSWKPSLLLAVRRMLSKLRLG